MHHVKSTCVIGVTQACMWYFVQDTSTKLHFQTLFIQISVSLHTFVFLCRNRNSQVYKFTPTAPVDYCVD